MPRKCNLQITEYIDSDDECPSSPSPAHVVQSHTHIQPASHGLSTTSTYYEMPASPQKRPTRVAHEHILWRDDEPMSQGHEILIHSDDDEDDVDCAERMLEPGYVSTVRDDRVKRKRTFLGDNPLLAWIPEIDVFVQELLRHEGCSNPNEPCPSCFEHEGYIRCIDCSDDRIFCRTCIIDNHLPSPFHRVQEWNGSFFKATTLKMLGLRIQLGHALGTRCMNPALATKDDFVVVDINAIHSISLAFCNCEHAQQRYVQLLRAGLYPATVLDPKTAATFHVLKHFQMLSFMSKVSAFEFYYSIARQTDNTGCNPPPDRYYPFLRMVREWRHIRLLKRMGRGHDPSGVKGTKEGECALICPACPQPGKNLPTGWKTAPEDQQWLYTLFLGIDANFRLKRLNVSTQERDPGLNHGFAYVVEEIKFKQYLRDYGDKIPDDVSTCNNHDALKSASMRGGKGTAASGVGAIDCIRHDMKRPVSVGDLQKGERYVNMDYFFLSTLQHNPPDRVLVSYDISCQWARNFIKRLLVYPILLAAIFWTLLITYVVPKFHLAAHRLLCQASFSLNFTPHVGRTDGEAPERGWASTNAVANSTKEMGPGSRRDTLDDHFGDYNWRKVSSMAVTFLRKVKEAVPARDEHVLAFEEFNAALPVESTKEWAACVEAWERDSKKPNPFYTELATISEHKVRLQLAEEDKAELDSGRSVVIHNNVTPSMLVTQGIELESQQCRLRYDCSQLGPHSTNLQRAKIIERKNVLRRRIDAWCEIQVLYMPGIAAVRAKEDEEGGGEPVESQDINLMLPSQVVSTCSDRRLLKYEWRLRYSQALDFLADIRRLLLLSSQLYKSKDLHARGQRMVTRSLSLILGVNERLKISVGGYHRARAALTQLASPLLETTWEETLRPLLEDDVRIMTAAQAEGVSEGRRTMSWIWRTAGVGDSSAGMQEALRLEWCKTRARAHRWQEECLLLEEEMRRVQESFLWEIDMWKRRASDAWSRADGNQDGQAAYALRQANVRELMLVHCRDVWVEAYGLLRSDVDVQQDPPPQEN